MIGFDRHAVFDEMDRQRRVPRQQFVHQALEVGRQVLNDHERHARVLGQVFEEANERIEPARGGPDSHDKARRHDDVLRTGASRRTIGVRVGIFVRHRFTPR